jgi:hypothetical protein
MRADRLIRRDAACSRAERGNADKRYEKAQENCDTQKSLEI